MLPKPTHFFKYASAAVGVINLRTQRIRWNSPLNYNDPFDGYFGLGLNFDPEELRTTYLSRLVEMLLGEAEPAIHPDHPLALPFKMLRASRHRLSLTPEFIRREYAEALDESLANFQRGTGQDQLRWSQELSTYRLLCVCEEHDNLLLWSHYAHNHRGVVLQFECIPELDTPLLAANPVTYSDEVPTMATRDQWLDFMLGLSAMPGAATQWHQLLHTKSRAWEREREWRVVATARPSDAGTYEDRLFSPREISKIFLGCRIPQADRDAVLALVTGEFAHVEVYQARQAKWRFALEFDRINDLGKATATAAKAT